MTNKHYLSGEATTEYIRQKSVRETEAQRRLREETGAHPRAIMQIAPEQGSLLQLLVRALGVTRALEIGVFTGYSSLAVALALPERGELTACDVSEEYTAVARRYWREAGVEKKIDLRLGPAADTLRSLIQAGRAGTYDFAFIDADKSSYDSYYELCLELVRPGGLIVLDNMLFHGQVTDSTFHDEDTEALRALNSKLAKDERVLVTLIPMTDGISLAWKNDHRV